MAAGTRELAQGMCHIQIRPLAVLQGSTVQPCCIRDSDRSCVPNMGSTFTTLQLEGHIGLTDRDAFVRLGILGIAALVVVTTTGTLQSFQRQKQEKEEEQEQEQEQERERERERERELEQGARSKEQ